MAITACAALGKDLVPKDFLRINQGCAVNLQESALFPSPSGTVAWEETGSWGIFSSTPDSLSFPLALLVCSPPQGLGVKG